MNPSEHQYLLTSLEGYEADTIFHVPAYLKIIQKHPGTIHENHGDFFSQASPSELPSQLEQALVNNVADHLGWQTKSIPYNQLRLNGAQENTLYLLTEGEAVHIYPPETKNMKASLEYQYGLHASIHEIASSARGTLITNFNELEEGVNELYRTRST